ncbi:MAG: hypothetical protein IPK12_00805 [Gemmatimonadetes bacterium]|nr:hypothetical protein [Gemmatimonadota bacterium]
MRRLAGRLLPLLGLTTIAIAPRAGAQAAYPVVRVGGRMQSQFYYFSNKDYAATTGPESNFFTRRARIEARAQVNEYVTVVVQPSFEGGRALRGSTACAPVVVTGPLPDTVSVSCNTTVSGGFRLRDAYVDVRLTRPDARTSFFVRAGQEKRPFSRYELLSSNNLISIERGAGSGLVGAASNNLFVGAAVADHDVGAHVRMERKLDLTGRMVMVEVGVYNGRGESLTDNNNSKSFTFRATGDVWQKLNVGGSYASHDGIVGNDSTFRNHAYDLDAQWNKPGEPGLFLLAEYLHGERFAAGHHDMTGFQALAAYNIHTTSPTSWLYAVEPFARFDYADPDTGVDENEATLFTTGVGLYLTSRAHFRVAYERQDFQASGAKSISGVRSMMAVNF